MDFWRPSLVLFKDDDHIAEVVEKKYPASFKTGDDVAYGTVEDFKATMQSMRMGFTLKDDVDSAI